MVKYTADTVQGTRGNDFIYKVIHLGIDTEYEIEIKGWNINPLDPVVSRKTQC